MTRIFRPLESMSSWRRLAPHVWDRPHDPTVYGVLEVVVDRALPYLDALSREAATRVRVSHLVTKALGARDSRAIPRRTASSPAGASSCARPSTSSCRWRWKAAATSRARRSSTPTRRAWSRSRASSSSAPTGSASRADPGVERTKGMVTSAARIGSSAAPSALMEWLIYDLQIDLSRFGIARDQFGSAMVSNIGNFEGFGMSFALAPLVPISRVPDRRADRRGAAEAGRRGRLRGGALGRDARVHVRPPHDRRRAGDRDGGRSCGAVVEDPEAVFGPVRGGTAKRDVARAGRRGRLRSSSPEPGCGARRCDVAADRRSARVGDARRVGRTRRAAERRPTSASRRSSAGGRRGRRRGDRSAARRACPRCTVRAT